MPGLGGLDCDLCSLQVANLSDHDDVRVLAQERAQCLGKIEPYLGVDVHLVDALEIDFNRVLRSGDVALCRIENVQSGVQRDCFTGTGWAGDQNHTLWLIQDLHVHVFLLRLIAEGVDTHLRAARVKDTQYDFFPEQGRQRIHTKIDSPVARQLHLDASVLGDTPLGNIHLRHHFQPRGKARGKVPGRFDDFLEYAVCAKAYPISFLIGLEVNIRGTLLDGVDQHLVDEAYNRCLVQ